MTASNHATGSNDARRQLDELLDLLGEEALTADGRQQLNTILREHPELLGHYLQSTYVHAALTVRGQEMPLPVMDPTALARNVGVQPLGCGSKSRLKPVLQPSIPHSTFRLSAIAAVAAFIAIGILAYSFWPGPAISPVVQQTPPAKIANLTDAKWEAAFSPAGDSVLTSGQRLILQSGTAEITFNSQARIVVDGPAEFTIVDATACQLATGKLTAQVPDLAKGFKVHTPSGTVTDLGTEFGVYVDARTDQQASREEEQQPGGGPQFDDNQPPITEVHVFKGQVEVARSEVGSGKSEAIAQNPTSDLRPPTILSAGQAVTISDNKVQPLPAADPFKFALDKLQGKPRTVLLSDDFESYPFAPADDALARPIGPWIVQTSTRKGQGVRVEEDLVGYIAKSNAQADEQDRLPVPPPSIGKRTILLLCAAQNPKDTYPLLAREIDGRPLSGTCQVLIELELMPVTPDVQPSFALAADAGHAPGLELWRNADAAAPPIPWSRGQCYRVRVLLGVVDGTPREARVERSAWRGAEGWVRDASYATPVPPLNWKTPPRFAIVGFPTVSPATPASIFRIDNVRVEVIAEK